MDLAGVRVEMEARQAVGASADPLIAMGRTTKPRRSRRGTWRGQGLRRPRSRMPCFPGAARRSRKVLCVQDRGELFAEEIREGRVKAPCKRGVQVTLTTP